MILQLACLFILGFLATMHSVAIPTTTLLCSPSHHFVSLFDPFILKSMLGFLLVVGDLASFVCGGHLQCCMLFPESHDDHQAISASITPTTTSSVLYQSSNKA
ncbi:hypothetical protein PIB30_011693 [Stylosanthes scabra]|uniref:Uncharacterized protein n=1 Tax=Stylosanthes scabra TaxID=79078 RepID=A0ABU6Y621_9FABA|nr:hypothetical protein [Stylosanthes scabra]